MDTDTAIRIVEVSPRDGLQNIPTYIPASTKTSLIAHLSRTGLRSIELTSIVSPQLVPQLSDCRDVLRSDVVQKLMKEGSGEEGGEGGEGEMRFPVLVPNLKGLETALQYGVKEVAVFVSAAEGFSRANINCDVAEGLRRAVEVARRARGVGVAVRGYISCIFTDPTTTPATPTPPSSILTCVNSLLHAGCYEISLGDTTGCGTAHLTTSLIHYLTSRSIPISKLAAHFHDTHNLGLENVWAAYCCGVRVFDSSVAGLGGCPFAPGARGNVATEEVVGMFEGRGVKTGVDELKLKEVVGWVRGNGTRISR
ncbi:hypothetical protein BDV12DRAFT_185035 [Aspergillus spectabilis]